MRGNASERYLSSLCQQSFLRLWSYPHIYRDQRGGGTQGKEVCDLLAIFGNHIFIFSDKSCEFPNSGDLNLDWARWYRRAILKSADQVLGAERWIRNYPDRLFLDADCTKPFPIRIPPQDVAIYHRIVVAHGAGPHCRNAMGGSGSLMLMPTERGPLPPFAIGAISPDDHYIHVIDDFTLDVVLNTLDTAPDVAQYLERKEAFIESGRLAGVAGEEELLAYYLQRTDAEGNHSFEIDQSLDFVVIDEGLWERFSNHPDRQAQVRADKISYAWDSLIDKFAEHTLSGTQYYSSGGSISDQEEGFRIIASENRTRRRLLSESLSEVLSRGDTQLRAARVHGPFSAGDPYYVFLSLQWPPDKTEEDYREVRRGLLESYCLVVRSKFADADRIIGIATEPLTVRGRSEDFAYFDGTDWSEVSQIEALRLQKELGILEVTADFNGVVSEYPSWLDPKLMAGRYRNQPCPCGSGRKLKKCHGVGKSTPVQSPLP